MEDERISSDITFTELKAKESSLELEFKTIKDRSEKCRQRVIELERQISSFKHTRKASFQSLKDKISKFENMPEHCGICLFLNVV